LIPASKDKNELHTVLYQKVIPAFISRYSNLKIFGKKLEIDIAIIPRYVNPNLR